MGRYVTIFLLILFIIAGIYISLPVLLGFLLEEVSVEMIIVLMGAFIITQLFYIIDLVKKNVKR
jgi:hypothetical protein